MIPLIFTILNWMLLILVVCVLFLIVVSIFAPAAWQAPPKLGQGRGTRWFFQSIWRGFNHMLSSTAWVALIIIAILAFGWYNSTTTAATMPSLVNCEECIKALQLNYNITPKTPNVKPLAVSAGPMPPAAPAPTTTVTAPAPAPAAAPPKPAVKKAAPAPRATAPTTFTAVRTYYYYRTNWDGSVTYYRYRVDSPVIYESAFPPDRAVYYTPVARPLFPMLWLWAHGSPYQSGWFESKQ